MFIRNFDSFTVCGRPPNGQQQQEQQVSLWTVQSFTPYTERERVVAERADGGRKHLIFTLTSKSKKKRFVPKRKRLESDRVFVF